MEAPRIETQDAILAKLDEIPALPSIVYELSRVINDPMSSTSDVEKIMALDQGLTTKVLRLVNSAYYAIPGGVISLSRAIGYIGFDTVNQLVLSASILKALEVKGPQRYNMDDFWQHSIGVGTASETIAKFVSHPLPADLFTCGLVHDMGKVAIYTIDSELFLKTVDYAKRKQISYTDAEDELGTPTHSHVGQMLAHRWKLPASIRASIAFHHERDPNLREGLQADQQRNVDIVFLANILVHALKFGNSGHDKVQPAPRDVMERLTIDPDRHLKTLLTDIKANLDKTSDFMKALRGGP